MWFRVGSAGYRGTYRPRRFEAGGHRWTPTFTGPDTFTVKPGFNTAYVPKKYPPQEKPLTHAPGEAQARVTNGCLEQVDATTFRLGHSPRRGQGWVNIFHPGDAEYRFAEQVVMPRLPKARKGQTPDDAAQVITFAPPAKLTAADLPLGLAATASSGLSERFVVRSGPAHLINGDRLELTDIPVGAPRPLMVRVEAYQIGSMVAPRIAPAEVVMATITIDDRPLPPSR